VGFDSLVYVLVGFVVIDYINDLLRAVYAKRVSSDIGSQGICRKILIFALIALGNIIDQYLIGSGSALRIMLLMFYPNEGISILGNASKMEGHSRQSWKRSRKNCGYQ
jgi:toxin secretion/phage lysis holin